MPAAAPFRADGAFGRAPTPGRSPEEAAKLQAARGGRPSPGEAAGELGGPWEAAAGPGSGPRPRGGCRRAPSGCFAAQSQQEREGAESSHMVT